MAVAKGRGAERGAERGADVSRFSAGGWGRSDESPGCEKDFVHRIDGRGEATAEASSWNRETHFHGAGRKCAICGELTSERHVQNGRVAGVPIHLNLDLAIVRRDGGSMPSTTASRCAYILPELRRAPEAPVHIVLDAMVAATLSLSLRCRCPHFRPAVRARFSTTPI